MRILTVLLAAFVLLFARAARADEEPAPPIPWQVGPTAIEVGGTKLALPEGYRFLGQPKAGELMTKMGNLHNENLLGLVISTEAESEWLITLRYDEEGFIKDDEKLDGKAILDSIREGEEQYNDERKKAGFAPIHADGWLEEPRYEKTQHHVVWGLLVSDDKGSSVNFNTRILGRKGYVSINLITEKDALQGDRKHALAILEATTFTAGNRYEDFDATKDKVAEYGLTGLVLGGAGVGVAKAVKIGLIAKMWKGILAVLIAGKKAIIAAFAALAALLRKVFTRKKNEDAEPTPPA